jgi:hypothetical protein
MCGVRNDKRVEVKMRAEGLREKEIRETYEYEPKELLQY